MLFAKRKRRSPLPRRAQRASEKDGNPGRATTTVPGAVRRACDPAAVIPPVFIALFNSS
jgi:hypothetical protein